MDYKPSFPAAQPSAVDIFICKNSQKWSAIRPFFKRVIWTHTDEMSALQGSMSSKQRWCLLLQWLAFIILWYVWGHIRGQVYTQLTISTSPTPHMSPVLLQVCYCYLFFLAIWRNSGNSGQTPGNLQGSASTEIHKPPTWVCENEKTQETEYRIRSEVRRTPLKLL